jgi:hypothetical protein
MPNITRRVAVPTTLDWGITPISEWTTWVTEAQAVPQRGHREKIIRSIQRSSLTPNGKSCAIAGVNREFENNPTRRASSIGSLMTWAQTVEGQSFWEKVNAACRAVRRNGGIWF